MFKVDCSKIENRGGYALVWQEDEKGKAYNAELMPWEDYFNDKKAGKWDDIDNIDHLIFDTLNEAIDWIKQHMPYMF